MAVFPKLIYRVSTILVRIPDDFFVETGNVMPKLIWNCKGSRMAKIILKRKNKVGRLILLISKCGLHYYMASHSSTLA